MRVWVSEDLLGGDRTTMRDNVFQLWLNSGKVSVARWPLQNEVARTLVLEVEVAFDEVGHGEATRGANARSWPERAVQNHYKSRTAQHHTEEETTILHKSKQQIP